VALVVALVLLHFAVLLAVSEMHRILISAAVVFHAVLLAVDETSGRRGVEPEKTSSAPTAILVVVIFVKSPVADEDGEGEW
jgi:hypothetical protein